MSDILKPLMKDCIAEFDFLYFLVDDVNGLLVIY